MSYILEALKKAEERRSRSARVPTLSTTHRAPAAARHARWPWVAVALIVICAAPVAWMLRPNTPSTTAIPQPPRRDAVIPPPAAATRTAPAAVPPAETAVVGGASSRAGASLRASARARTADDRGHDDD